MALTCGLLAEKAKTIDLCNNPMTKEPKLSRARRLLPEWNELDAEANPRDESRGIPSVPASPGRPAPNDDERNEL